MVTTHELSKLQFLEPVQTQYREYTVNGGGCRCQQPDNSFEREAFIPELKGPLQMQWNESPQLAVVDIMPIQNSAAPPQRYRYTILSCTDADPRLSSQGVVMLSP